jgi:hypothetical protein
MCKYLKKIHFSSYFVLAAFICIALYDYLRIFPILRYFKDSGESRFFYMTDILINDKWTFPLFIIIFSLFIIIKDIFFSRNKLIISNIIISIFILFMFIYFLFTFIYTLKGI